MSSNLKYANRLKKDVQARIPKKKEVIVNQLSLMPLSKAVGKYPQFFDEIKISAVQKGISSIDRINQKYQAIETLYLSNNSIKSLNGIQQFQDLQQLSIANNEIEDISFLRYLKQVPSLQNVNLKGNKVCKHPAYRQLVITILPNLKVLDDKQVTKNDRNDSEIKLKKHNALLDILLSNYCEIIQLNSFNKRLDLHKNMISQNYRYAINDVNLNIEIFRRNFNYQNQLNEEQRDELRENLMRDILTLFYSLNEININAANNELTDENYERSFSELIMRQKHKVAEIEVKIEQKIERFLTLKNEIRAKFDIEINRTMNQTARFKTDPGSDQKTINRQIYNEQNSLSPNNNFNNTSRDFNNFSNLQDQQQQQQRQQSQSQQNFFIPNNNNNQSYSNDNFKSQQYIPPNLTSRSNIHRKNSSRPMSPNSIQQQQQKSILKNSQSNSQNKFRQPQYIGKQQQQFSRSPKVEKSATTRGVSRSPPVFAQLDEKDMFQKLTEAQNQLNGLQSPSQTSQYGLGLNVDQIQCSAQQQQQQQQLQQGRPNQIITSGDQSNPFIDNLSPIKHEPLISFPSKVLQHNQQRSPLRKQNNNNVTYLSDNQTNLTGRINQINNNRSLSPQRDVPQPSQYPSNNKDCCRKYMGQSRSVLETSRRSISPNLMGKKTLNEVEKVVDNLNNKLNDKLDQIAQLEDMNDKYKNKIREFYAQNQSNVVLAQNSLEELDMELLRKNQVQKVLEDEVKNLRSEMNSLLLSNYELEKTKDQVIQLEQNNENYKTRVEQLQDDLIKEDLSKQFNERRLKKNLFQYLRYAVKTQSLIRAFRSSWDTMYAKNLAFELIPKWKTLTLKKKYVQVKNTHINLGLMSQNFKKWKQNVQFQRNIQEVLKQQKERQLKQLLDGWRWFVESSKYKKQQNLRITQFRTHYLQRKSLLGFKMLFRKMKLTFKQNKEYTLRAEKFEINKKKRTCFKAWKNYYEQVLLPRKEARLKCDQFYQRNVLKFGFKVLVKNQQLLQKQSEQCHKMNQKRVQKQIQRIFVFWKNDLFTINEQKNQLKQKCTDIIQKRNYQKWKEVVRVDKTHAQMVVKMQKNSEQSMLRRTFQRLKQFRQKRKLERVLKHAIQVKQANQLRRNIFSDWFKQAITKKTKRIQTESKNAEILNIYWRNWTSFIQARKIQKSKQRAAILSYERKRKQQVQQMMFEWQNVIRRKKRNNRILANLEKKKKYNYYRVFVIELHKLLKNNLRYTINKISNKTTLIEANYKQYAEQMNMVDEEKQELVQQIDQQQISLQQIQEQNIEKDTENMELRKIISQMENKMAEIQNEHQDVLQINKQMEQDMEQQQNGYQEQVESFERNLHNLTQENQNLQDIKSQLQKELEVQHSTLHRTERNMIEKSEKVNQMIQESEAKLQKSIMMANEFKNRILEQEEQISGMQQSKFNLESQNSDIQMKLEDCMKIMKEQQEMYENKIGEQDRKLGICESELVKVKDNNKYLRQICSDLKVDLKKYEYEVDILTEDNHQRTNDFIDQLQINSIQQKQNLLAKSNSQKFLNNMNSSNEALMTDNNNNYEQTEPRYRGNDFGQQRNNLRQKMNELEINLNEYQNQNTAEPTVQKYQNSRVPTKLFQQSFTTEPFYQAPVVNDIYEQDRNLLSPKSVVSMKGTPRRRHQWNSNTLAQTGALSPPQKIVTESITQELERNKSARKKDRNNLENRMKALSKNLESDLAFLKDPAFQQF